MFLQVKNDLLTADFYPRTTTSRWKKKKNEAAGLLKRQGFVVVPNPFLSLLVAQGFIARIIFGF